MGLSILKDKAKIQIATASLLNSLLIFKFHLLCFSQHLQSKILQEITTLFEPLANKNTYDTE